MKERKLTASQLEKAKAARRAYDREWRRANPDKVRAIQERYWLRRAEIAEMAKMAEVGEQAK